MSLSAVSRPWAHSCAGLREAPGSIPGARGQGVRTRRRKGARGPGAVRAAASAPGGRADAVAALAQWVRDRAGLSEGALGQRWAVEARPVPAGAAGEGGWGLFAVRDVGSGEEALAVPESACLGLPALQQSPLAARLSQGLSPWASLATLVLVERAKGPASPWGPYLASLPTAQDMDSLILWSPEELQELEGAQVLGALEQYRDLVAGEHAALQANLTAVQPSPPEALPPALDLSLPAFTWAFALLCSRTFAPSKGPAIALAPLLDLVNHGVAAPGSLQWTPSTLPLASSSGGGGGGLLGGLLQGLQGTQPALALVPGKPFKAGQQVLVSYGADRSNGDLLLDFGFVDEPVPLADPQAPAAQGGLFAPLADWVGGPSAGSPEAESRARKEAARATLAETMADRRQVFALTLEVPEGDRFGDDKLDVLEQAGLPSPHTFELRLPQPVPVSLLAFLRLAALSGPDAFLLEALFRNDVWDHLQEPISAENEEAVCRTMVDGCRDAIAAYATTAQQDEVLLRNGALGPRARMAVVVRLGEKRVLGAVLQAFEQRLQNLDSLEFYAERRLRNMGLLDDTGNMTPWATAE